MNNCRLFRLDIVCCILTLSVSSSYAVDLLFLGGKDISDFAVVSQTPDEIDYTHSSFGDFIAIRVAEEASDILRVGVECCVSLSDFEWQAESDSITRSERVGIGHLDIYADAHFDRIFMNPFLRCGIGLHWGRTVSQYQRGDVEWKDCDGLKTVPGFTLGGGFSVPLTSSLFCQVEADYNFVERNTFSGWQVEDVSNMNSWQLLFGIGVRL